MSYTIGRYPLTTSRYALDIYTQIGRQILLSFLTLIGSLFAILIGILFFGQETVQIGFQQFLFNHAIIISIFSFAFQILLAKYLLYQHSCASTWTYIGTYDSFVRLRACINLTRVPVDLNSTSFKQIQVSEGPFVVEGFSKVPPTCLQDLSIQRSKGISVLSEFKWCEIFLQRLPIHIISIEDVLPENLKIKNFL